MSKDKKLGVKKEVNMSQEDFIEEIKRPLIIHVRAGDKMIFIADTLTHCCGPTPAPREGVGFSL